MGVTVATPRSCRGHGPNPIFMEGIKFKNTHDPGHASLFAHNQKNYCNTKDCVSVQDFYFSFCSVQFNIYVLNIYIFYILFKGAFPFSFFASTFNFNNDARIPVRK